MADRLLNLLARLAEILRRPRFRAPGLALLVALAVLLLSLAGAFRDLEYLLLDLRFTTRPLIREVEVDPSIATVDWDEQSVQMIGRWPWTWDRHAQLLRFLGFVGARQIVLAEPFFDEPGPKTLARKEAVELQSLLANLFAEGRSEEALQWIPSYDALFVRAVQEMGRVAFAVTFVTPGLEEATRRVASRRGEEAENNFIEVEPEKRAAAQRFSVVAPPSGDVPPSTRFRAPLAELARAADGLGFVRIVLDPDGVARRIPAMTIHGDRAWPHLAVAAAARHFGVDQESIVYRPGRSINLTGARTPDGRDVRIPIDERGMMAVNWVGHYVDGFPHYPFLMIAEQIEFLAAKRAVDGIAPGEVGVDNFFERAFSGARHARFLPDEQSQFLASMVTDAAMVEHFLDRGATFEDYVELYLGGVDAGEIGQMIWNAVSLNHAAVRELEAGRTPDYAALLGEIGASDTDILRANFDLTVRWHSRAPERNVRPLYHLTVPLTLADGRTLLWSPGELEDKTLFVGLTATALTALNPTPFEKRYQMLGLLPNAFNTIVTGRFIHESGRGIEALFVLIYAWLVVTLVLRLGTTGQLAVSGIACGGHLAAAWLLFAYQGIVLPVTAPVLAVVGGHLTAILHRYIEEERERRKVRGLFSAMVSPTVLGMIEDQPDRLALRGERKDATMFSSDVSGFTTISEGVTAQELANILNIYLTPMSNLIMKYDGFVDKYEGDAIKASYGVPLVDPRHPWKGVCAALEQQEELKVIARMLYLRYGVRITARMGVNTGIVAAGNMGSERKMQYTVMGDQVTLAEELEPINKLFESWIAIGPETNRRVADAVETRLVGVVLTGHQQRIPVHEPLGWRRDAWIERWKGRPVPTLFIEGWRRMTPEKALGYAYYFEQRPLPERPMTRRVKALFEELRTSSIETMQTEDILQVDEFRRTLAALIGADEMGAAAAGRVADYLDRCDALIKDRGAKLGDETGLADAAREEILGSIDILAKRVACYRKRLSVTDPTDTVAKALADHLEKCLGAPDRSLDTAETEQLTLAAARMTAAIRTTVGEFLATLEDSARAEDFHEYIADLCAVSDESLRLREIFNRARALFLKREWDSAEKLFREALAMTPSDGPSIKHLERIAALRAAPPPSNWEGDWEEG